MPGSDLSSASSVTRAGIVSPLLDALCTGGLSLVVVGALVSFGPRPLKGHDYGAIFALGLLLNWPHFIASYRLLYGKRENLRRYPAAAIWVPLGLVLWCAAAIALERRLPAVANSVIVVGSLYLARHYTGQTWGMMATFAHVCGTPFSTGERRLVRLSLDLLMVWHGVWAASQTMALVDPTAAAVCARMLPLATWLRMLALPLGAVGLVGFARRHRRLPPARVLVPWVAIHVWYVALAEDPTMLFAVQLAHALQYLIFPARIELNRAKLAARPSSLRTALLAYAAWTVVGTALFEGLDPLLRLGFGLGGGTGPLPGAAATVLLSSVGIHHYFVDGALFKLRNPEVRRDLFAHLAPPAGAAEPPYPASARASSS